MTYKLTYIALLCRPALNWNINNSHIRSIVTLEKVAVLLKGMSPRVLA